MDKTESLACYPTNGSISTDDDESDRENEEDWFSTDEFYQMLEAGGVKVNKKGNFLQGNKAGMCIHYILPSHPPPLEGGGSEKVMYYFCWEK